MTDRVLLSASRNNIKDCVELASEAGTGIELMAFAFPDVLDGDWKDLVETYRTILQPVTGMRAMHGPFMDMVSGSPDALINQICLGRYQHAIRIAERLETKVVVFHANFIGTIRNPYYREGWHERNVAFWGPLAEYARRHHVTVAMENMWEYDPHIIADVLEAVDHPNLRACIDVGHVHLFSDEQYSFDDWLATMEPWLVHMHMNNNNGVIDTHHSFDWDEGDLDYHEILAKLRALDNPPSMTLEMADVEAMRESLPYFKLGESKRAPA